MGVHIFPSKKADDLYFSRCPKAAKLTTSTLQPFPAQQTFPQKMTSCSAWGALLHLQLAPINYTQNFFSHPEGALPGYAYDI